MILGWNGKIGDARWWARALGFAAALGALLGIVGPFGSYLNGDVLVRIADWAGMLVIGTVVVGIVVPLTVRAGQRLGLPRVFALAVALLLAAVPISVMSALVARTIWPWQTAGLRAVDWYGQTLLIESCVVALWVLVDRAFGAPALPAAKAACAPGSDIARPTRAFDAVLCLQMEDHYVRVHRPSGSTLELMTLADAIARYGEDGLQVHRSWWIASAAIEEIERDGRNWRLRLANKLMVPVARNRLPDLRARGWLT